LVSIMEPGLVSLLGFLDASLDASQRRPWMRTRVPRYPSTLGIHPGTFGMHAIQVRLERSIQVYVWEVSTNTFGPHSGTHPEK